MLTNAFVFAAGLFVGWFLLPTPQWATNLWNKLKGAAETPADPPKTDAPKQ